MDELLLAAFNYVRNAGAASAPLLLLALIWQTRELVRERKGRESDRSQAATEANRRSEAFTTVATAFDRTAGSISDIKQTLGTMLLMIQNGR
jgi:hypothetical protein